MLTLIFWVSGADDDNLADLCLESFFRTQPRPLGSWGDTTKSSDLDRGLLVRSTISQAASGTYVALRGEIRRPSREPSATRFSSSPPEDELCIIFFLDAGYAGGLSRLLPPADVPGAELGRFLSALNSRNTRSKSNELMLML